MNLRRKFSDADLQRIKEAVRSAEARISGEIVPVMVERSGAYTIANYRAGVFTSLATFSAIILIDRYVPDMAIYDPLAIFVVVLATGFVAGLMANFFDPVKRLLLSQLHMDKATRLKAESCFLQQEVFNTRQRTGIMIFVSFLEREVIVMADRGISQVVEQKVWDKVVSDLIEKIKLGKPTEGLVAAIVRCGEILLEHNFAIAPDDTNELKDDLRIE